MITVAIVVVLALVALVDLSPFGARAAEWIADRLDGDR